MQKAPRNIHFVTPGECEKYLKNIKVATAAVAPRYKF
jgi:hypothetical protein